MDYPETFLRGLSGSDWVADGIVSAGAFQIQFVPKLMRNGCAANSIGWEDDGSVVEVMFLQKNTEGFPQFKAGLARFPKESINRIIKSPAFRGILSYEREPLEGNPYHGNLLVSPTVSKTQKRLLPGVIAAEFSEIIARPEP